jgi:hypothetical protein
LHVLPPYYDLGSVELGAAILSDLIVERRRHARERIDRFLGSELGHLRVRRALLAWMREFWAG